AAAVTAPMSPAVLSGAASMADWLIFAALADGGKHIAMNVYESPGTEICQAQRQISTELEEEAYKTVTANLSFVYPHREAERLPSKLTATELKGRAEKIAAQYPQKADLIAKKMNMLTIVESAKDLPMDKVAKVFGEIMAEVFVYKDDVWKEDLYRLGFFLGKYIYLLDAYEDIEKDLKTGDYNPFREICRNENFDEQVLNMLLLMIGECTDAFERLPLVENVEILRNILYSGVWVRYGKSKTARLEKEKKEDN
ncbi:MAG: hypothetical protein II354_05065, partial [Firmicutes bacterium]|nr:hypothetical protein [Bacillota bacterium]